MEIIIGTTTATKEEARNIASACVRKGVAACAHIDEIESVYTWQGAIHSGTEFRVNLKTIEDAYLEVAAVIQEHHSYDEPAIFCTPITGGVRSYLDWIRDNSQGKAS